VDKLINKHVDSIEELERQLDIIIEQEVSQLDIDAVIASPQEALTQAVDNIKRVFLDEYADKALEMGFDFGRQIQKRIDQDKAIKVDDSNNPTLNADGKDSKQD
jgi:hypothetical protein